MNGVSIIIPTYNRKDIVATTVRNLLHYVIFDGDIQIIVSADANDGTYEEIQYMNSLSTIRSYHTNLVAMHGPRIASGGKVTGLGANLNHLLHAAAYPIIMQMDDDHWLTAPLDINRHVQELLKLEPVAWIRLMGVSGHKYNAQMIEQYWHIDWNSSELYIPSNRPHIKHKRFHEFFGYYPEGLSLGETEEHFCHQCKDKIRVMGNVNSPHVCVPVSLHEEIWSHVGESWQAKGE